jgi:hypothetical protein
MVNPSIASGFIGLSRQRLLGLGFKEMSVRIGFDRPTPPIASIAVLRSI